MTPGNRQKIWLQTALKLLFMALMALGLSACGGGGGGGGGSAPGPSPQTIQGSIATVLPIPAQPRTGSAGMVYTTDEVPVTSGSLSLVRVNPAGVYQESLADNIPISASGSFSVTLPAGHFGSSMIVLSHSFGFRAVVTRTTQQKVDIISSFTYQQATLAGLDLFTIQALAGYEDQLTAAWRTQGIAVSPIQGQQVELVHLVAGVQSFAETRNLYLASAPGQFCTQGTKVIVATGDSLGGSLGEVCLHNNFLQIRTGLASLSGDILLKSYLGDIGVLAASPSHSLATFNPVSFRRTRGLLLQDGPDQATNPLDFVLMSSTRVWLSNEGTTELLLFDPTSADFVSGKITTLDLADSVDTVFDLDGKPEPGKFVRDGDRLYVTMRRLDTLQTNKPPASSSALITIDSVNNAIVDRAPDVTGSQPLELPGRNCQASGVVANKLFVACSGYLPPVPLSNSTNLSSDGLYAVDLVSLSVSQILSNAELGKKVISLEIVSAESAILTLKTLPSGEISLVRFNPTTNTVAAGEIASGIITAHGVDAAERTWISETRGTTTVLRVLEKSGVAAVPFPLSISIPIKQFLMGPLN